MKRLGYARYGAQGGDVGALISKELGILKPEGLAGVHLQQIFAFPTGAPGEMEKLDAVRDGGLRQPRQVPEVRRLQRHPAEAAGDARATVSSTRRRRCSRGTPSCSSASRGRARSSSTASAYLTHVSIYWFTATGAFGGEHLPRGCAVRRGLQRGAATRRRPASPCSRGTSARCASFAERSNNIVHWTEMPRGGHFAASDAPELLVADMRTFFGEGDLTHGSRSLRGHLPRGRGADSRPACGGR